MQAGDHLGAGNVLTMPESDSGAPAPPPEGPPARPPGPAPDGFVPREWVETHHAHVRGLAATSAPEESEGPSPTAGPPPAPPPPPPSALTRAASLPQCPGWPPCPRRRPRTWPGPGTPPRSPPCLRRRPLSPLSARPSSRHLGSPRPRNVRPGSGCSSGSSVSWWARSVPSSSPPSAAPSPATRPRRSRPSPRPRSRRSGTSS